MVKYNMLLFFGFVVILVLSLASCLPPPDNGFESPQENENITLVYESEQANIQDIFIIGKSNSASNGTYIYQPSYEADTTMPFTSATIPFTVKEGLYKLWVRVYAPSLQNDAFYTGFDDNIKRVYPSDVEVYQWIKISEEQLSGDHNISIGHGESELIIDLFVVSNMELTEQELDAYLIIRNDSQDSIPDESEDTNDNIIAYEQLLDELVGFGQYTTGGKGGRLYTVTSLDDSGIGTLREALRSNEKLWIKFGLNGTITLSSPIESLSDKTIDGRGADITIAGNGIYITGKSNVIINNIKIRDTSDDAIRVYNGARRVWIHHTTISNAGDGAIDVTENVDEVTISYNHIFNHDKAMLIGAGSDTGQGTSLKWTAHHNWYNRTIQRLPMLRMGKAHSYNNLFNWVSGTAMEARISPAQLFSENDILAPLNSVDHKVVIIGTGTSVKFEGTYQKPYSNTLNIREANREQVFNPRDYYDYTPDIANAELEAYIKANAGWKKVSWPK